MTSVRSNGVLAEKNENTVDGGEQGVDTYREESLETRRMSGSTDLNQWIVSALEQAHHHRPAIAKEEIMKDVMGHMCTIMRIHLTWPSSSSDLPSTVIAKIPNTAALVQKLEGAYGDQAPVATAPDDSFLQYIHENEIDTYAMLSKSKCEGLAVPFFYGALPFSSPSPCILIEDIHSSGTVDLIDGFNDDQLYAVVDQLAALHAYCFTHYEWERFSERCIFLEIEGTETYQQFLKMSESMNDHLRSQYPVLKEGLQLLYDNYTKNPSWCLEQFRYFRSKDVLRTFVHGDLWAANILWRGNNLAAIVDWAGCHVGSLTEDLQRVLVTSCSAERRERLVHPLLKYYFDKLQMKLEEKGKKMPFKFEGLQRDYFRTLPYTCGQTVFAIGIWLHSDVIRIGKADDEARIQEMVTRLHSIVEETVLAHKWHHEDS